MNAVFLDTVGLLALWDKSDQWNTAATKAFAQIARERSGFISTSYVLLECANAAARRPYREQVDTLHTQLLSRGELIFPNGEDWDGAWAAYRKGEAGGAGVVDQVSFIVMRRLGLSLAFTNDAHFQAAGFQTAF